jgi:AAA domain
MAGPQGNPPLAAVAIDTLARAMQGADENTAKDMTTFVDNCGIVGDAFNCLVLGVHHAGKDVTRGSRGSNALDGAVDVMWSVEKGEVASTAAIHHMKDGEEGLSWQFRLAPYTLVEATETKGATTTCVVEIVQEPQQPQRAQQGRNKRPLADQPKLLLGIIRDALSEAGEFVKGDMNVPHDVKAMARDNLKRYLPLKGYWDDDRPSNTNRAILSRDLKLLAARGYIGLTSAYFWSIEGRS